MDKSQKEQIVAELTERLQASETLIVADYRGLTMPQVDALRTELLTHGAKFQVVKNTLTRRAAEAAGADHLLALLEGPTAIAFLESDGDAVAVAKALRAAARETQVIEIRGGVIQGRTMSRRRGHHARDAPVARGAARPGARRRDGAADDDPRPVQRAAAEPRRADRRPDRAARGAGRHVGRRRARRRGGETGEPSRGARAPTAEAEAEPAAEAEAEPPAAEADTETTTEEEGEDQ